VSVPSLDSPNKKPWFSIFLHIYSFAVRHGDVLYKKQIREYCNIPQSTEGEKVRLSMLVTLMNNNLLALENNIFTKKRLATDWRRQVDT
jgi:hypothetical protein